VHAKTGIIRLLRNIIQTNSSFAHFLHKHFVIKKIASVKFKECKTVKYALLFKLFRWKNHFLHQVFLESAEAMSHMIQNEPNKQTQPHVMLSLQN